MSKKTVTCTCLDCGKGVECSASDYKKGWNVICYNGCYQKRFPEQVKEWRKEYTRLHELLNPIQS